MERIRKIKIRTRLFIGFGFVILAMLIVTRGFQYGLPASAVLLLAIGIALALTRSIVEPLSATGTN